MNTCLDCGKDYKYDPNDPRGASSLRCPACRKRETIKNKKIILFNIAGNGTIQCRKCGYSRCENAITLADTTNFLNKATTQEEKENRAKSQYLLCLNCEAEIKSGEVEAEVVNSKSYPVVVRFYEKEVRIVRTEIKPSVEYSNDVSDVEVTTSDPASVRVVGTPKRIARGTTIDLPSLP